MAEEEGREVRSVLSAVIPARARTHTHAKEKQKYLISWFLQQQLTGCSLCLNSESASLEVRI